jgi:hypothetical protein
LLCRKSGTIPELELPRPPEVAVPEFALTDPDAAGERAAIVADTVVGDFKVMAPAVNENAAAALGTVGDQQAVNT